MTKNGKPLILSCSVRMWRLKLVRISHCGSYLSQMLMDFASIWVILKRRL